MSVAFYTRLPLHGETQFLPGDGRNRGDWNRPTAVSTGAVSRFDVGDDFTYIDYLSQIARAAEINRFDGVLMVNGQTGDEPWMISALLARETKRLKFVTAFHPYALSPWCATQMAATYQRATGGRLVWNIIQGGSDALQHAIGDRAAHDERYVRASEYLDVVKGFWNNESFFYDGNYYTAAGGGLRGPLRKAPLPLICTAGASDAARDLGARHADYYLMTAEQPSVNQAIIDDVRERAARLGRTDIRFGLSVDVIARPTDEEAFAEARRFYDDGVASGAVAAAAARGRQMSSTYKRRRTAYYADALPEFDELFVAPNVWSGFGLIGIPPGFALVGSYQAVAERILDFHQMGFSLFFLAGYPHLEEAYRLGEHVLPRVRAVLREAAAAPPVPARDATEIARSAAS
jgi:alkanesulfonate monooxygenase